MTSIAVMQPYFMPYLGYYRLLHQADVFVAFDCVQFPRRGWVHRNRLHGGNGELAWLTLPIRPGHRSIAIDELVFDHRAETWWDAAARRFPALRSPGASAAMSLAGGFRPGDRVADYLVDQLTRMRDLLGLQARVVRSRDFGLPAEMRGEARIIEICRRLDADRYLNAPNGRELYDPTRFAAAGIELSFLPDWSGSYASTLERTAVEPVSALQDELAINSGRCGAGDV
ncbi:MAG: WbqC family protein [Thalassobaculum sp.]|uniref:WbqC family protein n=1 Tax=Thalassobaculum sp. TaxID=2022740 RepID=UPI0032EE238D